MHIFIWWSGRLISVMVMDELDIFDEGLILCKLVSSIDRINPNVSCQRVCNACLSNKRIYPAYPLHGIIPYKNGHSLTMLKSTDAYVVYRFVSLWTKKWFRTLIGFLFYSWEWSFWSLLNRRAASKNKSVRPYKYVYFFQVDLCSIYLSDDLGWPCYTPIVRRPS